MTSLVLVVRISRIKAGDAWISGRLRLVAVPTSSRAGIERGHRRLGTGGVTVKTLGGGRG